MRTSRLTAELLDIGSIRIHVERRGTGPALLFIPGGGVDATHFATLAELLADDYHTICYDRRGYYRSPAPPDSRDATVDDHADDAAALLRALGVEPVAVWGGSIGGIILLSLLKRYPDLVRAAIVHEPPLFTLLDEASRFRTALVTLNAQARREGARSVMADHARAELGEAFNLLNSPARDRMLDNAEPFLLRDIPGLIRSIPGPEVTVSAVPTAVLRRAENDRSMPGRAAEELAKRLGVPLEFIPGGHIPYLTAPESTAASIKSILQRPVDN